MLSLGRKQKQRVLDNLHQRSNQSIWTRIGLWTSRATGAGSDAGGIV